MAKYLIALIGFVLLNSCGSDGGGFWAPADDRVVQYDRYDCEVRDFTDSCFNGTVFTVPGCSISCNDGTYAECTPGDVDHASCTIQASTCFCD